MRYISGSSLAAFRECPRKGYLRYLAPSGGEVLGWEEAKDSVYLTLGIAWHKGAEVLIKGGTAEEAFAAANDPALPEVEREWLFAAFKAWERVVQGPFLDRWNVISVEEEMEVPVTPNVTLYTRSDAVIQDRADGSLWVLNWKTAGDVKDWNRRWFFEPQAWTESLAAESKLGTPVAGCLFYGIWKGPIYKGQISSRLIYGYRYNPKAGGGPTYGTENNGGGLRFETWKEEFPFGSGTSAWISWLPADFLQKHFVESAPQIRQDELVERWLRQLTRNEHDIDHIISTGNQEDIETFFWQNWREECGRCPFRDVCMLRATPESLAEEGLLRPRHKSPRDEAAGRKKED